MKPDEGSILEYKGKKVAVYKDKNGVIKMMSATCTHKGCTVMWNDDEKSWDCPCHGSKYDPNGKVVRGPAEKDLESVEI